MSLLAEIKRRKIVQVAAVYGVTAWLLVQIAETVEGPLMLPSWFDTAVIVLLLLGFPVTLIISWAFNLTSEGLVRERGAAASEHDAKGSRGRRIEYALIGLVVIAVGWLVYRVEFDPMNSAARALSGEDLLPNSVAVLPFENLSPNPDNAFFAAGTHEEVLNQLAKVSDLTVIARTSVLPYAGSELSLAEIADELRVEAIMEGSVRYAGDRVRVSAQLIDPSTGGHLWSNAYERDTADVFGIQADIATQIARTLEAQLLPEEQANISHAPTDSPGAYEWYLRELSLPSHVFFPGITAAHITLLDQAIAIDEAFAPAYARKAMIHAQSGSPPTMEALTLARENAEQALRLDPRTASAHLALALVHRNLLRAEPQRQTLEAALALAPADSRTRAQYGRFLSHVGEYEEAIRMGQRAVELDPNNPGWRALLGFSYLNTGDLEASASAFRAAIDIDESRAAPHSVLALIYAILNDTAEAERHLRRAQETWSSGATWILAYMTYASGRLEADERTEELQAQLEQRISDSPSNQPTTAVIAALAVRDEERARERLSELVRIVRETEEPVDWGFLFRLKINASWDPILEEPEFVELRSQLGYRDQIR